MAPAGARSPLGESNRTTTAAKTMAEAPLGHAVAIQKSSTAPIVMNARPALTKEGNQSGTWSQATTARRSVIRIGDEQREPVERLRHAGQHLGGLIGEQPQRWRAGRQVDQRPHRRLTDPAQADGVGDPAGRLTVLRRRAQLLRHAAQDRRRLVPIALVRQPCEVHRDRAPARQSGEQAVHGPLQHRRMIAELGGLPDRLVDHRIERDDPPDELASDRLRLRQAWPGQRQGAGKSARDFGRQAREQRGQPALGAAEIGPGEDDAGAHDADADLARAGDRQHEDVRIWASGRAERVGGDDRRGVAGERRRIGGEVAQQGGEESADTAPQRQDAEKGDAILRKAPGQHHDCHGAHHGADHAEPPFAQRSAKMRLTDDRRRRAGPKGIVELEPERDVERETDRSPEPQAKQQRRSRRS